MKLLRKWEELPKYMQTESVRPYYEKLKEKKKSLILKRILDIMIAFIMLMVLLPAMIILAIFIILDSKGGVFFRQERVTQYGRKFKILKYRTMVIHAEKLGTQVTVLNDMRITKIGKVLRKYRLDELPQLVNILMGDMSFVGTRPEVVKYVKHYTPEMMATLLLPAGVTSEASIRYKDEDAILSSAENIDEVYVKEVIPKKMEYNLEGIRGFSLLKDIRTMIRTVIAVIG